MFLAFTEHAARLIKERIEQADFNAIVAVHDEHTGAFYCAHIANGAVVYVETCGPLTPEQAQATAAALEIPVSGMRSLDELITRH